jgi:Na+/proline symporter
MFFGCGLFTYFAQNPDAEVLSKGGDVALFRFVFLKVPSPISGLFMAAMLAAIMSSLDSGINSMAAVWLKEFHVKFFNKNITPDGEIKVLRLATFIIGVFSIVLALALCVSGKYLQQSMTEIGTIFWLLGAATVPAFIFGVLTNRANSAYVWGITFFAAGETIATNAWYILSRRAVQVWETDPSIGLGWGGPLAAKYFIIPTVIALILVAPYLFKKSLRRSKKIIALALVGTIFVGLAFNMFVWYFFSNLEITNEPKARSFAFYIPTLILWAIVVLFCPKQPRENYQGLTIATMKDPILKKIK